MPNLTRNIAINRFAKFVAAVFLIGGNAAPASAADFQALPLELVADIPLGGNTTRLDYESIDTRRHLLFIAHLGDSEVIVFDMKSQRVVSRITGVSHVHGVLAIPERGMVYASATGTNEVVAIDETSLKITARVPAGVYPDGMAYAPDVHKLFVSDEHGNTDTVIDLTTNTRVATIPLGGEVGNSEYDAATKHVFTNVQTRSQLVEMDPATDQVVDRIDLPGAQGNHGLLIVPEIRKAFIACEGNNKLLVLDLASRKIVASFDVGRDPDVLAYDRGRNLLYVAGESGVVSLFNVDAATVTKRGEGLLAPHAHVVAVDPDTHDAYFPLMNVGGRAILRIVRPQT